MIKILKEPLHAQEIKARDRKKDRDENREIKRASRNKSRQRGAQSQRNESDEQNASRAEKEIFG